MKGTDNRSIYVVAICGSLRQGSTTHAALQIALAAAEEAGAEVEFLELSEYELVFQGSVANESDYPPGIFKTAGKGPTRRRHTSRLTGIPWQLQRRPQKCPRPDGV